MGLSDRFDKMKMPSIFDKPKKQSLSDKFDAGYTSEQYEKERVQKQQTKFRESLTPFTSSFKRVEDVGKAQQEQAIRRQERQKEIESFKPYSFKLLEGVEKQRREKQLADKQKMSDFFETGRTTAPSVSMSLREEPKAPFPYARDPLADVKKEGQAMSQAQFERTYPGLAQTYGTVEQAQRKLTTGVTPAIDPYISSGTLGLSEARPSNMSEQIAFQKEVSPIRAYGGMVGGYFAPGGLFTKAAAPVTKSIMKPLVSAATKKITNPLVKTIAKTAKPLIKLGVQEGIAGGTMEATEGLIRQETPEEIAKRVGWGTLLGGIGAPTLSVAGKGLAKTGREVSRRTNVALDRAMGDMFDLPTKGVGFDAPLIPTTQKVPTKLKAPEEFIKQTRAGQRYGVINEPARQAEKAYQEGFDIVSNKYGTTDIQGAVSDIVNEYRPAGQRMSVSVDDALDYVKADTGVDLRKLQDDLVRTADVPAPLPTAEGARLRRAAGVAGEGQYKLARQLQDVDLPTVKKKPITIETPLKQPKVEPTPLKAEPTYTKYKSSADLPRNAKKLDEIITEMEQARKKGIEVDLQLFAEAKRIRSELAKTVGARIDFEPDKKPLKERVKETLSKEGFEKKISKFRSDWEDRLDYIRRSEEKLKGKKYTDIPAEESVYKQARLHAGTPERAKSVLENELYPILKDVDKVGYKADDLTEYAAAVHAKDIHQKQKYGQEIYEKLKGKRNRTPQEESLFEQAKEYKNYKTGFTDEQIKRSIDELKDLEPQRQKLVDYQARRLKEVADSGRISQDMYNQLREKWKNYVPMQRSFGDDKVEIVRGMSEALGGVTQPIQKFKGSTRRVKNPLESIIKNTFMMEDAISKQQVVGRLKGLSEADVEGSVISRLTGAETPSAKKRMNIVKSYENGKEVEYAVNSDFYKAFKGLENLKADLGTVGNIVKAFTGIKRAGATLTPDFSVRNPIRDFQQAYMTSPSGATVKDFMYGFLDSMPLTRKKILKDKSLLDEFIKNRGGYGGVTSADRNLYNEAINKSFKKSVLRKTIDGTKPKTWLRVMQDITSATENMSKLAEYRAARRKGFSKSESAYRARDVMDFARAGHQGKAINQYVAFFNANIQGKSKYLRALKENPKRVISRTITTSVLPVIGLHFANKALANDTQKRIIDDAPDWMRDSFHMVAVPYTDEVIRIPKAFETAPLMSSLEASLDYLFEKDKNAYDDISERLIKSQALPMLPSLLTEGVEVAANYSFFRDAPIVPLREKYREKTEQKDVTTSFIAEKLGGLTKQSPRKIDYAIKSATAGLGKMALDAVDYVTGKSETRPAKGKKDIPVLSAFAVKEGSSKSIGNLYDEFDKLTKQRNTAKDKGIKSKDFKHKEQYEFLKDVTKEISEISKDIRTIQNDESVKPKDKREQIAELKKVRAIMAYEEYKRYKKELKNK